MKIVSVEIQNFLAITEGTLHLEDRGLLLIQGVNNDDTSADSNGSGKSSLADALCWALYGVTARGVTGDDVINHDAGKDTRVVVTVQDEAERYWITRHRKHKPGKNSLTVTTVDGSGADIDLTKGTEKLTQDVVNKIIGASLEVFRAAVYAGQEQMPDLPAMTDKHLKILIEEASGVSVLEAAYKEARERANAERATYDALERSRIGAMQKVGWADNQLVASRSDKNAWAARRATDITDMKGRVQGLVARVKELDADIAKVDETALVNSIADLNSKLAAVADEQVDLRRLSDAASQADTQVRILQSSTSNYQHSLKNAEDELAKVAHKVGCPCDECGRPLTNAELDAAKLAAQKKRDVFLEALNNESAKLDVAIAAQASALSARDTFAASMTDTSATNALRASLQSQIDALRTLQHSRANTLQQAKTLGEQMKTMMAEANPYDAVIARQTLEKAAAEKELAEFETKVAEQMVEVETAEAVAKVFSPAGVRAHILDEVTPFLNQQTARYLSTLSDGNIEATWTTIVQNGKGELREKFSIEVTNDKGGKSFAGLSGGEKRKVRVSTALALQDLVATRALKPIDLFIGDEIDDALDNSGLERLTQILEEKANERGTVAVISHNSLRDWVSQVISVEKTGGKTRIVEEVS